MAEAALARGLAALRTRALLLKIVLAIHIAVTLLGVITGTLLDQFLEDPRMAIVVMPLLALSVLLARVVLFAFGALFMCLWVLQAWKNLYAFRLEGLRYSPGWAAASLYVPVADLYVPFIAMRELYNRSMGEDEHQADGTVDIVTAWWACLLVALNLQLFSLAREIFNLNGVVQLTAMAYAEVGTALLLVATMVGAAACLWCIVSAITRAQEGFTGYHHAFA